MRVHEKLVEEEGVTVTYSTLTRRLRELGISDPPKTRCQQVPDEPGAEMQHDTSLTWSSWRAGASGSSPA